MQESDTPLTAGLFVQLSVVVVAVEIVRLVVPELVVRLVLPAKVAFSAL